jgi:hypothetical protein
VRRLLLATGLWLALAAPPALAAGLALPPEEACAYLAEAGLPAASDYRAYREEKFYCWSLRRDLAAGDPVRHRVRYTAEGTAEAVSTLTLELQVVSVSEVQRALRLFLDYAKPLVRAATGQDLPEDVSKAVLSARPGRWQVGTADVVLEKANVRGAMSYDLLLRVQ